MDFFSMNKKKCLTFFIRISDIWIIYFTKLLKRFNYRKLFVTSFFGINFENMQLSASWHRITQNNDNVETQQFDEETDYGIALTSSRHFEIRKRATKTYLSNANKKIKIHDEFINDLSSKCLIDGYIGIKIDKVDRTNIDPKILPAVIFEKQNDKVKVACEFGIINQWWSLDSIVLLSTVPENLINLQTSELKEISFISAARLYVRGGIDGVTCSCKSSCKTKQCACRKKNIPCSTKCHKNGIRYVNLESDDKIWRCTNSFL